MAATSGHLGKDMLRKMPLDDDDDDDDDDDNSMSVTLTQ